MTLRKDLADPLARLQQAAKRIAQVQRECKLPVEEQEYLESFRPYLMDVVHAWSKVPPRGPGISMVRGQGWAGAARAQAARGGAGAPGELPALASQAQCTPGPRCPPQHRARDLRG